ncbi:hypothetical protein CDEST_11826 [Colletotrichum destructivum]|uniref:Rhodopsin domain-containing protein n=1 Tax=Colletotrichum destructivum TaxID=34406 RepID=A0AAX4IUD8_9PEZI|nr:hypothetical protein CDEST_11826 [Colletotrichum destructivum]
MADDRVATLIGSTIGMICLTTLVISVRIMVRSNLRAYGLDDRFGKHHQDISIAAYEQFLKVSYLEDFENRRTDDIATKLTIVTSATYSYGLALAKMSFAVLYIRMLPGRRLIMMNKGIIAFLCCQAIEESLIPVFQCKPVAKAWTVEKEGVCLDLPVLWWCGFAFNLCSDLILFIEPIPTLWRLQLPLVKRLGLIAMLSLGLMVVAISVIRMHSVSQMGHDDTYDLAIPIIWSEAEISTLIVCSCVPSLRKMLQKLSWFHQVPGLSNPDMPHEPIETIGQARTKPLFRGKGGQKAGCTDESDLTGTTTYPLTVMSHPPLISDDVIKGAQESICDASREHTVTYSGHELTY